MRDKRVLVTIVLVLMLALVQSTPSVAQKNFPLTIDNIMRGPGLWGYEPAGVRWSGSSQKIYFQWKQATDPQDHPMDTYVVNRDGSGLRKLSGGEAKLAPPSNGVHTRDHKKMVYTFEGDIYLYDFS